MNAHFHVPDRGLHAAADGGSAPLVVGAPQSPAVEPSEAHRKALRLWLQWNEAYENVVARMFRGNADRNTLEDALDRMDWLRKDAIELSRHLLQ